MRRDLVLHFYAGAAIAIATCAVMLFVTDKPIYWIPMIVVCFAGAIKEIYDKLSKKGTPEWIDGVFTFVGGAFGLAVWVWIIHLF